MGGATSTGGGQDPVAVTGLASLDALIGELRAERDRWRDLAEHRGRLLDELRNELHQANPNPEILTAVEAADWLETGTLPESFAERLGNFLEQYRCSNCDGIGDMNVVCRDWFAEEPSWCPSCCRADGTMVTPLPQRRDAELDSGDAGDGVG